MLLTPRTTALIWALVVALVPTVRGADPETTSLLQTNLWTAGMRGAFSANNYNHYFVEVEAFGTKDLPPHSPWRFESRSGFFYQTRLDAAAGWLRGHNESGLIGSFGPTFLLGNVKFPLMAEIGCSPTILSRYQFESTNLGFPIEFTSHIGVVAKLGPRFMFDYRFQHMSDAGITGHNPGLNMHALGLGYRF